MNTLAVEGLTQVIGLLENAGWAASFTYINTSHHGHLATIIDGF